MKAHWLVTGAGALAFSLSGQAKQVATAPLFTGSETETWRRRLAPFKDQMGALARSYRLPAGLLEGIAIVESSVNPAAISRNGSLDPRRWDYGLMQVNGTTGLTIASRRGLGNFGLTSLLDPELSVSFAAWLLADNRQVSGDADLESMASAYNWGLRSGRTVRPIPNPEYTSRVVALANASAEGAF